MRRWVRIGNSKTEVAATIYGRHLWRTVTFEWPTLQRPLLTLLAALKRDATLYAVYF